MRDPSRANKESREHNEMGEERQKLEGGSTEWGINGSENWREMREPKCYNFQLEFRAKRETRNK